jgi:hypothetical protein
LKASLISGLLLACPLIAGTGLVSCHSDDCGTTVLSSVPDPENGHNNFSGVTAQVIARDCGAIVDRATVVRLVDYEGKGLGNGDGWVFAYGKGNPKISVEWKDAFDLVINCLGCTDEASDGSGIFLKEVKHNFINIEYAQ